MTNPSPYSPSSLVAYCDDCDRMAAVPLSDVERARLGVLSLAAKTVGLVGKERGEYVRLSQRRNS